jgi:hypothetical protein
MVLNSSWTQAILHPLDLQHCDKGLMIHAQKVTYRMCQIHIYHFNRDFKKIVNTQQTFYTS